jgi:two-component system chemotaxis response regulator CheB
MVVDDSAAMRALFCDILDNAKGVEVCGTASNADEARDKLDEFRPDVLTLDVEMPGTSGLDFLAEIMAERPMPVIMLSSIAQAGSGTAARALELGAVHCFPKPLHTSREEFDATVAKLGEIVLKAASGELASGAEASTSGPVVPAFEPGGRVVALTCGAAGLETAKRLLAALPANCAPMILAVDAPADQVERTLGAVRGSLACELLDALDGMALEPGKVLLAADPERHVIVEAGCPPRLRQVARDPVAGFRPSADLLFGSIARAQCQAVAGVLVGTGTDGAKGLQIMAAAGNPTFVQSPADYAPRERFEAVKSLGLQALELKEDGLDVWLLETTAAT